MPDPTPNDDSARAVSRAVLLLSVSGFGSGISQRVVDPLLPRLADDFHVQLGSASLVITGFTLGYAACTIFFGPIGDRYGKYRVIAWACVAASVATLLCALANDLWQLLAARVLAGAMTAAIVPLSLAWLGDVIPYERRQPVLARFLIGSILGAAAGQLLGGMSADHFGRRVPFLVIALLFAVSAGLLLATRHLLPPRAVAVSSGEGHPLRRMWSEFLLVLASRPARIILLAVFVEGAAVFGAYAFFAAHVHVRLGVSLTTAGAVVMLFGAGGLVYSLNSGRMVAALGEHGLVRWSAVVMVLALCVIAAAPGLWFVATACLAMGFGFWMLHNTLQTNATQMAPERRGAGVATFALLFFLGQSLGVGIAGVLVSGPGSGIVMLASALLIVAVTVYYARARRANTASP